MALPPDYRYDGGNEKSAVAHDLSSNDEVHISGRFIRNDSSVISTVRFGSGGPYASVHDGDVCIRLPSRSRGFFTAIELTSSDTLRIHALRWDTYNLNAFPPL